MWFDALVSLFSGPVTAGTALGTALIVSLLTLLGVLLNLRHARKQAREEREFDTKRDLYLTVCEGMAAGAKYLAKFADFSLEPKEHEQIVAAFGKVHGVHLIASQASLKELIKVYEVFVQSVFEIQSKRLPAMILRDQLRRLDERKASITSVQKAFLGQLQIPQPATVNSAMQQELAQVNSALQLLDNEESELLNKRQNADAALIEIAASRSLDFGAVQAKAVMQLRKELDFSIDETWYENALTESRERVRKSYKQFVENIKMNAGM